MLGGILALLLQPAALAQATALQLVEAMGIPTENVSAASLLAPIGNTAVGVVSAWGTIPPPSGTNMAVLSSGNAIPFGQPGHTAPYIGTRWFTGPINSPLNGFVHCGGTNGVLAYEPAQLTVDLIAPTNAAGLQLSFNFFSGETETPCTSLNDGFLITVSSFLGSNNMARVGTNLVTVNSAFLSRSNTVAAGDTWTNYGASGWISVSNQVMAGEFVRLEFLIFDEGDRYGDSTVLLDDFEWLTAWGSTNPPPLADATAPALINYQGRLVDGTSLVNGTVELSLRLFTESVGGDILFEDSNTVVVVDGLYSTYIGDQPTTTGTLVHALLASNVYLEVVVNGVALSPRERMVAVPYSVFALNSEMVGGIPATELATGTPVYVETDPRWRAVSNSYYTKTEAHAAFVEFEVDPEWTKAKPDYYTKLQVDALFATGTPVYVESDPVWAMEKSAYATGTPLYAFTETDPTWTAASNLYYLKSQADTLFATGTPVYAESDPVWLAEKSGYATGTPLYAFTEVDPLWAAASNVIIAQINDEASARSAADTALGNDLAAEASVRVAGDAALSNAVASANADRIAADAALSNALSQTWRLNGNTGTVAGTHFLGTTDNRPLEIRVNNLRAALIQPGNGAPNLVLGAAQNTISNGTVGSSILGGSNNTIDANNAYAVISGGGNNNVAESSQYPTIAGGFGNEITANSDYAFIAGGYSNRAAAAYTFVGGRRAKANHAGSFVWADSTDADFGSGTTNQFLVRANFVGFGRTNRITPAEVLGIQGNVGSGNFGGIYINTDSAGGKPFYGYSRGGSNLVYHYTDGLDGGKWKLNIGSSDRIAVLTNGFVGIGTTTPTNLLHVNGTVQALAYITGSDRNAKENIRPIEPAAILEKVVALPISTWTFKQEPNGTHLGPMAQDFHAAFGLGNTDTGIMTVDADGVALAAIQALAAEKERLAETVSQFSEQVSRLEQENTRLREDLEAIRRRMGM
jgi:hypothetical protein